MILTTILSNATPNADVRAALANYNAFRASLGHGPMPLGGALLGKPSDNAKTDKTVRPVYTLSLSPHNDAARILGDEVPALPGRLTTCPWSTPACRSICVSYGGNGAYPRTQRLRAVKTAFAALHPADFLALLLADVDKALDRDPDAAFRLNTFSDIAWERILPAAFFARADVYDYTKGGIKRFRAAAAVGYHVTLSVSERTSLAAMDRWIAEGANAAVVFPKGGLPATFRDHVVVDGDTSDDRLADPRGVVVGLSAKGRLNHKRHAEARVFIRGAA